MNEELKNQIYFAKVELARMKENNGVVDLEGNIEAVGEWYEAYLRLQSNISRAWHIIEQEEKGE